YTSIPSMLVAATVFLIAGLNIEASSTQAESIMNVSNSLQELFQMNILLIIPALIVVIGSLMRKPVLIVLFLSSFSAMILSLWMPHGPLTQVIAAASEGFHVDMLTEIMQDLLSGEIKDAIQELLYRCGNYS